MNVLLLSSANLVSLVVKVYVPPVTVLGLAFAGISDDKVTEYVA
jgi:hypothetical protein